MRGLRYQVCLIGQRRYRIERLIAKGGVLTTYLGVGG
jgi:hypothetical protein